ncbi:hypothetical protein NC661_08260 [Aquibacillus koreensis]|uniref:Uncharacterized protein n=1 Tax=Aquibacillus koreensis TaxID=279446 RepID=A0A9X4AHV8_9BACI|nr:hypothetical protein [Aquibacillus koreensis]MCT2535900.1 hypothetical protein [Aquibacillus koreensis]MDC3420356.1 hypothetical protein [Aquibacillus koreensis]
MKKSETYLDFCFIQEVTGDLVTKVQAMFEELFKYERLHWYLDAKEESGAEIVVAEVKGMSRFESEQEVIDYLEENADELFWKTLQGYQFQVLPV